MSPTARARLRAPAEAAGRAASEGGHRSRGHRRAVGPVPPGLQLKEATVGRAGDAFEQEADRAAERIVQGKAAPRVSAVDEQSLQRQTVAASVSLEEVDQGGGVVQRLFDEQHDEEPPDQHDGLVQQKSGGSSPASVDVPDPGAGNPLPPTTRSTLESGLGADLGGVRVHDDSAARAAADRMGAKAFTQGRDISLGSGQSADDLGLLAHEAAHVVQQSGGSGSVAQKADPTSTQGLPAPGGQVAAPAQEVPLPSGSVDPGNQTVTVALLSLPESKLADTRTKGIKEVPIGRERDGVEQGAKWTDAVSTGAEKAAADKLADPAVKATKDEEGYFYLVHSMSPKQPIVATPDQFDELAVRPTWDKKGVPRRFDIDHKVEWQLGGDDVPANYWLMEEQANRSAGSRIRNALEKEINKVLKQAADKKVAGVPPDRSAAKAAGWKFSVKDFDTTPMKINGQEDSTWAYADIEKGVHIEQYVRGMSGTEMEQAGGSAELLALYLGPMGGVRTEVEWGKEAVGGTKPMTDWWFHLGTRKPGKRNNNFSVTSIHFRNGEGGVITGTLFKSEKKDGKNTGLINEISDQPMKIKAHAGGEGSSRRIPWAGFIDEQAFLNEARAKLTFKKLSPIVLDDMALAPDRALVARGRLLPTVPLIDKAAIDVVIDGDEVYLSKLFTAEDFTFPGPITVGACSLELRLGLDGFKILGDAGFEIQGLGQGRVHAAAGASTEDVSFALGGEFDFLSDLFDPARVEVWYRDGELGGKGVLGVKEGTIKGLRSAQVTVDWGKDGIKAAGTFATTIPGVESGTLAFAYREDGAVELGGTLDLGSEVPGISSGSVEAQLVRVPEGGWKVFGKIQATPSIPGVASRITGTYDDGAIQVETTVAYARGMAAGQLTVGLTNRPLDPAGKPAGEPGADLAAYGGGQVALTLAPWLRATAGLRLLPSGEIEVSGQVGLPSALEVFPRKSLDRELFEVGVDIPIIGISVAGANIGIFATVAGGAQLLAYFGPAELRDLSLGITWNPDHEDQTTVKGHAALHLPAGAGIRLAISAALGAGIPVVEARLGLEIGGTLGIEAAVGAGVDIDWTPTMGLVLDAVASAHAEPVFRFDVTGFARVDLDLWLKTINLWEKKWQLAAFEYGSGLRLGMSLPIHYEEGEPFEPSLSDVTFEVPSIDPKALLSGLVDRVT